MMNKTSIKLTRRQAAAVLGISESELKSKDGEVLHPTKASDGSWVYSADEVGLLARGGDSTVNTPSTGATCGTAFELFTAGKSMTEVVIALKQPPATVRALRSEYDSMAGCLTLSTATVLLIERSSRTTVRDEQQLLGLIESLRCERDAAYQRGRADANDWGEVLDRNTGRMKPVNPAGAVLERLTKAAEPAGTMDNAERCKPTSS